jgi:hypothetical protein
LIIGVTVPRIVAACLWQPRKNHGLGSFAH